MGSLSGTGEIVEVGEDPSVGIYQSNSQFKASEKNKKPLVVNLGYKDNIYDDINKLFESIALKSSSPRDLSFSQDGTSTSTLKQPMTLGVPRSPRVGASEAVNLKQALRDLCISKASEVAAMKRLSKSTASPRVSEVRRIQTLYTSVVDEPGYSGPYVAEGKVGFHSQRVVPVQPEKQTFASSPSTCVSNTGQNGSTINKPPHRAPRTLKMVIKNKNVSKKKVKEDSNSALCDPASNEFSKSVPATARLVCERCRCALENTMEDVIMALDSTSPGTGVKSSNLHSGLNKPGLASTSGNISKAVAKVEKIQKSTKLKEQHDFSQSSKSSQGEYSSSTSTSDDSNMSGSSCGTRPHMSKDVRWEAIRHAQVQQGVLGLKHFNLLKKLGCGDIGTVYLAELIGTSCLFAIKVMDIEFLARRKKMPRAQTEREILRMLDHPFLPTLYVQFTSDNLSCLVMEYCPGGDLHVLRQKQLGRCFSELAARFYVAEVLLALEYLHMLGVVYRDLKPENILVREDGHIMLTDFDLSLRCAVSPTLLKSSSDVDPAKVSGLTAQSSCIEPLCIEPSCQVSCFSPRFLPAAAKARKLKVNHVAHVRSLPQLVAEPIDARSNSFVGTHEYLAPEIIKEEGHGAAVDWWTFGVFLYELLYGRTPFKGYNNEETLANVVSQSLRFPDDPLVSFEAKDLIRGLLVKEPENRLGSERGAAEIKKHPFFEGLNWALIRCATPPELPEFCDFGVFDTASQGKGAKYLEYNVGEHVEFELF
ncbi:unnamed protein product [Vicia faba]|uniref:non-specific serine/threonine protein kinase n=1 Tax=Vicia faba TaxID=3906 RepID=A0AAV1AWG2_VICFA|nr:unnamed protein product [Vicia faba]